MKNVLFASLLAGVSVSAFAGEFGDECAFALSMGKHLKTDCSISEVIGGKTLCFSSAAAKATFDKYPEMSLKQAKSFYEKEKAK